MSPVILIFFLGAGLVASCPNGTVEFNQNCVPDNQLHVGINITFDRKFVCGGTEEIIIYFPPGTEGTYRGDTLFEGNYLIGGHFRVQYSSVGRIESERALTECVGYNQEVYISPELEGDVLNFTSTVLNLTDSNKIERVSTEHQNLTLTFCGDGIVQSFELCDYMNDSSICTRDCQCDSSVGMVPYQGNCIYHCGNRRVDFGEECDGNQGCQNCQCLPNYFPDSGKCLDPQKDPIVSNQSLFLPNHNLTGAKITINGYLTVNNATIDSNTDLSFTCLNGTLIYRSQVIKSFSIQYNCSQKPKIIYQNLGCYQANSNITQSPRGNKMTLFFSKQSLSWRDRLRKCQKISRGCQCDQATRKLRGIIAGSVIGVLLLITLIIVHAVPSIRDKIYPWRKKPPQ